MLRLPYLRITPAIASVSSYITCSARSKLSATAIISFASCQPHDGKEYIITSTRKFFIAQCNLSNV